MYSTGNTHHKCYECMFSFYKSEGEINNLLTSYHTRIYNTYFIDTVLPTKKLISKIFRRVY